MKKILILLSILAVIILAGCTQKQPLLGESCGTVSPDSRDECCANKMKDAVHPMCVGAWQYNPSNDKCAWVCQTETAITNFEECAAAGNPIMESYPRQCAANGQTFTEEITVPIQEPLIGGQRDEHGCLGPAGYSWDAEVGACIRVWELDEQQKRAAKIAVEKIGQENGLTIDEVLVLRCPGCFTVTLSNPEYQKKEVTMEDWKVTSAH